MLHHRGDLTTHAAPLRFAETHVEAELLLGADESANRGVPEVGRTTAEVYSSRVVKIGRQEIDEQKSCDCRQNRCREEYPKNLPEVQQATKLKAFLILLEHQQTERKQQPPLGGTALQQ